MLPLNLLIALGVLWLGVQFGKFYARRKRLTTKFDALPGATTFPLNPIFDSIYLILINGISIKQSTMDSFVMLYDIAMSQCKVFEEVGLFRWYLGFKPVVFLFSPENVEPILQSTTVLDKADEYQVFEPWIGEGLVTSNRKKWHTRRKLLTPAFHFKILNDFVPIMNQEARKLARKLNNMRYSQSFNVMPVIALCTLDAICETAMGVNINCQANEHSDYVRALYEVGETTLARVCRPWLWPDWAFYMTHIGKRFAQANKVMHDFTRKVIIDRKDEWQRMLAMAAANEATATATAPTTTLDETRETTTTTSSEEETIRRNRVTLDNLINSSSFKDSSKRLAFLDLMMHHHLIENSMSLEDIREEVDTFMFAGHDTTAMNISWVLYLLGLHDDIQERVRRELDEILDDQTNTDTNILGQDCDRPHLDHGDNKQDHHHGASPMTDKLRLDDITVEQLARMKYLDMVIKETLRIYPSIPFIARQMTEDVLVGGKYLIPKGSTCTIFTHALHHNASVYPRPEVFDPDRFLPENVSKRHPFAFIPFSAGARNCIGQKFAKMEVKIILVEILRNYRVKSMLERDKLKLVGELVLRPTEGLHIRLTAREH